MKQILIILLIVSLLGCESSKEDGLIADIIFVSESVESCIKERAEAESFTKVEELTEVLCKGGYGYSNLQDLNHFPNLKGVALHSLDAHEVNFDNILYVERLSVISSEQLRRLTIQNSSNLETFKIENSHKVNEVSLDNLPELKDLTIRDTVLETLDIGDIQSLESLSIGTYGSDSFLFDLVVSIESLDLTANQNLEEITLKYTKLKSVMLEGLNKLKNLTIHSSELEQVYLDLPSLEELVLFQNKISSIDLGYVPKITHLQLQNNFINEIDLDPNTNLSFVRLTDNSLSQEAIEYLDSIDWIDDLKY